MNSILPAQGQDKALVEAARKEGKVTIFGSLQEEVMKAILESFDRKYPGVKSVYWRASTTAVMDRAINEFRTGKVSWDIFFTGVDAMEIMRAEGMFLKYQTPASKNFDKEYHHAFYSPNYRSSIIGFVYNTRYIKPAEAPKSYWDYADPKWDGKTTMRLTDPQAVEEVYQRAILAYERVPMIPNEAIETVVKLSTGQSNRNPFGVLDMSILERIEKEGFVRSLYSMK